MSVILFLQLRLHRSMAFVYKHNEWTAWKCGLIILGLYPIYPLPPPGFEPVTFCMNSRAAVVLTDWAMSSFNNSFEPNRT